MILGEEAPPGGWDDVIVGAGSAGAVLAGRLSECPGRRVLLIEAGVEQTAAAPPPPLGHSVLAGANWDFEAWLGAEPDEGRPVPYPVGKTVGGSSAVNAAIALRGLPADFDGWAAAGNPEWSWDRVRPYFARLESDANATGPEHGVRGPIPVRRPAMEDLGPLAEAFLRACRGAGLPYVPDLNGSPGAGAGLVPSNARDGRRVSTADAYLMAAAARPNLTLVQGHRVTRVITNGRRVVGVEARGDGGEPVRVPAGRVTLSAGAIGTPLILQRSGIGGADRLGTLGITPITGLPGVGQNLADHPAVAIWALPRPDACRPGRPLHTVMARTASGGDDLDLCLFLAGDVVAPAVPTIGRVLGGRPGASLSAVLMAPASRGRVCLRDATPDGRPVIVLRLAAERRDMERLMTATRMAWSLIRSADLSRQLQRVFVWTDRMVGDDALLESAIRRFAAPLWHPAGTARMGPVTDDLAVVDERCRVHTMTGLNVVDASVMPSVPRATPNLSCVMLAERVAEWMA